MFQYKSVSAVSLQIAPFAIRFFLIFTTYLYVSGEKKGIGQSWLELRLYDELNALIKITIRPKGVNEVFILFESTRRFKYFKSYINLILNVNFNGGVHLFTVKPFKWNKTLYKLK